MKHFGNVIKAIVVGTLAIRSTMKAAVSCCVILLVVMAAMPARALEPWVLYDDFTTPLIDPDRWAGFLSANRIVEIVRVIDDLENELRLDNRGYGNTNSDSGTTFNLLGLQFTNPAAVTAIQTTVKVSAVEVTSCTANPLAANSRVRLTGRFFNTGTPIPGSDTGNVIANIFVRIRSNDPDPSTMRVLFDVFECLDASCDNSTILASGDLGTVSVNQPVMLQMQWDQPNQKFIFQ